MGSYSSSNIEPERWAKIVKGADSGHYPHIMVDEGKLVTVPKTGDTDKIQSFLADVFKDGDNEWFDTTSDSVESSKGKAADAGKPETSKKKKVSLTQQRMNARQEKKDRGLGMQRVELSKGNYTDTEWKRITGIVSTQRPAGVSLEGGKVVATHHIITDAQRKLDSILDHVLQHDTAGRPGSWKVKGPANQERHG
ncbi:MAG: hypothetical protein Q9175_005441 [Cornicularia normoerica]